MRKSILRTLNIAAIAALVCAGCTDVSDHGDGKEDGIVDKFLGLYTVEFSKYEYDNYGNRSYSGNVNGSEPAAVAVAPGNSITLPKGDGLTKNNYVFDGWNTKYDGTGKTYAAGSSYTPAGNVTLYPKWKRVYTITFSANDGTGTAPSAITADSGSSITLPDKGNLTRSGGYVFGGWNTSSNGSGTNYAVGLTYTPPDSRTLYAKWNRTYMVTFSVNGGVGTAPAAMTGDTITLPGGNGLTKSGYNFGGWFTLTSNVWTGYGAGSRYAPASDATMYAKWDNNTVTTFVDSRDGKTYKKVTIGDQTWMAENLNYDDPNNVTDVCPNSSADSCAKYGRMYNWSTAMGIDVGYNNSTWVGSDENHRGVCPSGWHLPSRAEWDTLIIYVGGASTAGTKLKSSVGWANYSSVPRGDDEYGFSALLGPSSNGWLSATGSGAGNVSVRRMYYNYERVDVESGTKTGLYSVRCVAD